MEGEEGGEKKKKKKLYVNVEGSEKGAELAIEARFLQNYFFFFFFFFFFNFNFFTFIPHLLSLLPPLYRDKGIEILEELETQGETLDRIEDCADNVEFNLKRGQRALRGIDSASGAG